MYTDCVVSALFLPPKFSRFFRGEVLIEYKGEKINHFFLNFRQTIVFFRGEVLIRGEENKAYTCDAATNFIKCNIFYAVISKYFLR